jgi:hypothetical protein
MMTDSDYCQGLINRGQPIPPGMYRLTRTLIVARGHPGLTAPPHTSPAQCALSEWD